MSTVKQERMKTTVQTSEEAASDFIVGLEVSHGQSFGPGLFSIFSSDLDA